MTLWHMAGSAVVVSGRARFTVLTSRLLRIEWKEINSVFEDRATTAFGNRRLDPVAFNTTVSPEGFLQIQTTDVLLLYKLGAEFSAESLTVASSSETGFPGWHYGQEDTGNLLGTIRTLDGLSVTSLNCTENRHIRNNHCAWGVVSRGGWAIVDDSDTYALNDLGWWVEPNVNVEDLYLFAHGTDYKGALADFVMISGRTALPPRAAFGLWWTRWYNLNGPDVRKVVDDHRSRNFPLDIFVLDMNWHIKDAWGAYTWDCRLFPQPSDVARTYHDTDGVHPYEEHLPCDGQGDEASWEHHGRYPIQLLRRSQLRGCTRGHCAQAAGG